MAERREKHPGHRGQGRNGRGDSAGEKRKGSRRREGQTLDPTGGGGCGDALPGTPGLEVDAGPHLKQGRAGR